MDPNFEQERLRYINEGFSIARVAAEHKEMYSILLDGNIINAEVTGRLMFAAESRKDFPAVGDWVAVQRYENSNAIIHHILPRKTCIVRKAPGKEFTEQIIAANIDVVFIIQSLDHNYNIRRLERFLLVSKESGAVPVVLLSKIDLITDDELKNRINEVTAISPGIRTIAYSAKTLSHIDEIKHLISENTTVCFIGSSGVGKSTLINRLIGKELLETNEVREEDSRGRHTTTQRQLVPLEGGGFVIDTPGMRELGLWEISGSIEEIFPEIASLAAGCKFTDCTHVHEPDCAVLRAIHEGELNTKRYESYIKLKKEAEYVASKTDVTKQQERKAKDKRLGRAIKEFMKKDKRR
ncbi:MAG: ribosome small subunit-dependent GTPase A [Bacteroidota bacterium]